jgi:hypothetical protein
MKVMINRVNNTVWANTIFCQFNDLKLYNEILDLANVINCEVVEGKRYWTDIISTPAFILIVDRNLIGNENWEDYLESLEDSEIDIPCLILDESDNFNSPQLDCLEYIPLTDENIPNIINKINSAYIIAQEIFENDE